MGDISSVVALYEALDAYVHWLAYRREVSTHVLLRRDELEGELYLEIVRGWVIYAPKKLQGDELLAVVRKMMDNRITTLYRKYMLTHREAELHVVCVDDVLRLSSDRNTEAYVDSREKVAAFFDLLLTDERAVVDALLGDDVRVWQQLLLRTMRKAFVFNDYTVRITSDVVADALHFNRAYARRLWRSICAKWRSCDDEE